MSEEATQSEMEAKPSHNLKKVAKDIAALSVSHRLTVSPCDAKLHLDSPSKILRGRSKEKLRQEPMHLECSHVKDDLPVKKVPDGGKAEEAMTKDQAIMMEDSDLEMSPSKAKSPQRKLYSWKKGSRLAPGSPPV